MFYPEPVSGVDKSASRGSKKKGVAALARPPPVEVAPKAGYALLHRHGEACMLHEARKVVEGEKWVIRSDLCVRR